MPSPLVFAHAECFLVPLEDVGESGISRELAAALVERGALARPAVELLDAAVGRVFRRLGELARRAPDAHLPPRPVNLCVVTEPATTRPYFQPFVGMSALVYASDFDPATSSVEHAAFQLVFAERLGQIGRFGRALLAAIPFLLAMSDAEADDFVAGAGRSARPDADVARRIASSLPELRRSTIAEGAGLAGEPPEGWARIKGTALAIRREYAPAISALGTEAEAGAERAATAYLERQASRTGAPEDALVEALAREAPRVLVTGADDAILWDPDAAGRTDALRAALSGIGDLPAASLLRDLRTVGEATSRFLALMRDPDALVVPQASLEEAGGVYVHHQRRLIAYGLAQPGLDALHEAAPPFHRLLLAARAVHEWGHLAVDGGVVPLRHLGAYEAAERALRGLLEGVVADAPPSARAALEAEVRELASEGVRLQELPMSRIEDYRSNLLARRILSPAELEAYVRANVRSLAAEPIGILRKLARYAYEAQYLGLTGIADPWGYFAAGTYFREEYVDSGIVDEATAKEMFRLVGEMCAAYAVDETKLASGAVSL